MSDRAGAAIDTIDTPPTPTAQVARRADLVGEDTAVAAGIIEQPEPKTVTTWDGPSWRASAKDYHEQRASRRTSETISPGRLAHLRRLMADDISIDRAWHELKADRTAPRATVDALMFSLRRGTEALAVSDNKRRLSELSEEQLRAVCHQLRNFKPEIAPAWTLEEVEALVIIWSELK